MNFSVVAALLLLFLLPPLGGSPPAMKPPAEQKRSNTAHTKPPVVFRENPQSGNSSPAAVFFRGRYIAEFAPQGASTHAVLLNRIGDATEISLLENDGTLRTVLRDSKLTIREITLSKNGDIALIGYPQGRYDSRERRDEEKTIWVITPASRPAKEATQQAITNGPLTLPHFSADGKTLYFWRKMANAMVTADGRPVRDEVWELFQVKEPWNTPEAMTPPLTLSRPISVSPAGDKLAYVRPLAGADASSGQVVVRQLADEKETTLTVAGLIPSPSRFAIWSGDGKFITFSIGPDPLRPLLDLVNVQTGRVVPLYKRLDDYGRGRDKTVDEGDWLEVLSISAGGFDSSYLVQMRYAPIPQDTADSNSQAVPPPLHWLWLLYDAATDTITPVEGLPEVCGVRLSPDGREAQVFTSSAALFSRQ